MDSQSFGRQAEDNSSGQLVGLCLALTYEARLQDSFASIPDVAGSLIAASKNTLSESFYLFIMHTVS